MDSADWFHDYCDSERFVEDLKVFAREIGVKPELLAHLSALMGKRLACWCAPEPCHGDILVKLADDSERICQKIAFNPSKGYWEWIESTNL